MTQLIIIYLLFLIPVVGYGQTPCNATEEGWHSIGMDNDTLSWVKTVGVDPLNPETVVAGVENYVFKSTNCGDSWNLIQDKSILMIRFNPVVSDTLYFTTGSTIYKSTDGGNSLNQAYKGLTIPPNTNLTDLQMNSSTSHILYSTSQGFGSGAIYKSENGGNKWKKLFPDSAVNFGAYDIALHPNSIDTIFVAANQLIYSHDGGASWDTLAYPNDNDLSAKALQYVRPSDKLYVGAASHNSTQMYYTTNLGDTWVSAQAPDTLQEIRSLHYVPTGTHQYQLWIKTVDHLYTYYPSDNSWDLVNKMGLPNSNIDAIDVDTASGNIFVGLSSHGIYVKNFTTTTSIQPIEEDNNPKKYSLKQNYPNPFNPSTDIRFSLPQSQQVIINVYNNIGQKIETLINHQMTAGSHSVTFTADGLPSGVYIYRIKAGEYTKTKKMMLLK